MVQDFFEIVWSCVALISQGALFGVIMIALSLGILCWIGCSYYTRLWHRRFHLRPQHHLLCAIAATLTVIFTVLFYAVVNLGIIVDHKIDDWSNALVEDGEWNTQTYETAYYAVMESYPNEFAGVPRPGSANSYIPVNNDDMSRICVKTYVEEACADFSTLHPFLDKMLKARPGISEDEILDDIQSFFSSNPGERYPLARAVEIATEHIRDGLLEQSPKTVWKTRLILVLLFLGVQLIPFGTITYCANEDLKRGRYKGKNNVEDHYY